MKVRYEHPIEVAAKDQNGEKTATFTSVALTADGQPFTPSGWTRDEGLVVDIAGMELPDQVVVNFAHADNDERLIGHGEATKTADPSLVVDGVFSVDGPDKDRVINSSRRGFSWKSSIEATLGQIEFIPAGHEAIANGRTYEGPVSIARRSELTALVILSRPADKKTQVEIFSQESKPMGTQILGADGAPVSGSPSLIDSARAEMNRLQGSGLTVDQIAKSANITDVSVLSGLSADGAVASQEVVDALKAVPSKAEEMTANATSGKQTIKAEAGDVGKQIKANAK